ncbi:hypothetical protein [Streptomyces exfoliatus]|uniref:hypothetical protein n=1 Tax=Streptomyces exfoliatus TaxID=1905 RepID=UPI003C2C9F79
MPAVQEDLAALRDSVRPGTRLPHRLQNARPEREEDEALTALQTGLDAAAAAAKAAGKHRLDLMTSRRLLLRLAALADRRACATELERLRDGATGTQVDGGWN